MSKYIKDNSDRLTEVRENLSKALDKLVGEVYKAADEIVEVAYSLKFNKSSTYDRNRMDLLTLAKELDDLIFKLDEEREKLAGSKE